MTTETATTEQANINRAVEKLGAVALANESYAYYADETGRWYRVTAAEMAELGEMLAEDRGDYSVWCAGSTSVEISDMDHDALDEIREAGGSPEYRCQCGRWSGERCHGTTNDIDQLVHVRFVREADKGSAMASGTLTLGAYATSIYVLADCAEMMRYRWEDGEQTTEQDPFVRVVGPAYK